MQRMNTSAKKITVFAFLGLGLLLGLLVGSQSAFAADIIVDNDDGNVTQRGEFGFYLEEPGRWTRNTTAGWAGSHRLSNHDYPGDARWYPMLPTAGDYLVYVRWIDDNSRDNHARYRINYRDGDQDTTIELNQRVNGDQWVYLGTYDFDGTSREYVELNRDDKDENVSADAVRFVLSGTSTTTTTTTTTTTVSTTSTTIVIGTTTTTTVPCPSLDLADVPLDAMLTSAPANIMFALDDSGSMDWEFVTSEADGVFQGNWYLFDDAGDNTYNNNYLTGTERQEWKSQWSGYNRIYYDPDSKTDYEPWPNKPAADPDTPKSHPNTTATFTPPTFNINDQFVSIGTVSVKNAHYYTWDDSGSVENEKEAGEDVYLVNLTNPITYYRFVDADTDDVVDSGELTLVTAALLPTSVITYWPATDAAAYAMEKQRFANWYSFYRKRKLIALGSVAKVIANMQGVNIGFIGINKDFPTEPPRPVKAGGVDESSALLTSLYSYVSSDKKTPLRQGIKYVGEYFDQTDTSDGGISATSPWADAADGGACQQAFLIAFTDGYYNGNFSGLGHIDDDNGAPYADSYEDTLADIAMHYYERDLVPDLPDQVPTNMYDKASHQHMVTYGVSFGVTGSLNPADYDVINGPFPTWQDPVSGGSATQRELYRIDDLWHATVNGRGWFYSAQNAGELVDAMLNILNSIEARIGSSASVSVNGDELMEEVGSNIQMYQTSFFSDGWGGDVKSYHIDATTGAVISEPIAWSADDLAQKFLEVAGHTNRIIATYDGTQGVPFRYDDLSLAQKGLMSMMGGVSGANMVNFLRGDDSLEQENSGPMRTRFFALGDIVNSSAVFDSEVLYAGSNDGMLHAIDAATGLELFNYIPNLVFDTLTYMADPNYIHKYYVDSSPDIKKMGSTTYLVGGLRKGGKGYYCLDISNPYTINSEALLAGRVKWEFPAAYDADMGYSFSQAFIVKSADTSINNGTDLEGYVVIFGNGYQSPNGHAVFYIVNPLDGTLIKKIDTGFGTCNGLSTPAPVDVNSDSVIDYAYAGDLDGNLWKFDLTDSSSANWDVAFEDGSSVPQPLFRVKDGRPITTKPDIMFQCDPNHGYLVIFGTGQYFSATDLTDTNVQAIYGIWDYGDDVDDSEYLGTFNPAASPTLSNQPVGVILLEQTVFFEGDVSQNSNGDSIGSSKWLRVLTDNDIERWVVADATSGQNPNPGIAGIGSDTYDNDLDGYIDGDDDDEIPAESAGISHAGWYFDLPLSGERVIVDVMIRDWKVVVISYIPQSSPCTGGGYSIVHELDACTGGRTAASIIDINEDNYINLSDDIVIVIDGVSYIVAPTGMRYEGRLQPPAILRKEPREIKYFSSSAGTIETLTEKPEQRGMHYWREMQ